MYYRLVTLFFLVSLTVNGYLIWNYFDNSGEDTFDLNGDGIIEFRARYDGAFERVDVDRNYDGRFDMMSFYKDGFIVSSRSDDNFDGYYETKTSFEFGLPTVTIISSNTSESPDITYVYENGVDSYVAVDLPYWKGNKREKLIFGLPESCFLDEKIR